MRFSVVSIEQLYRYRPPENDVCDRLAVYLFMPVPQAHPANLFIEPRRTGIAQKDLGRERSRISPKRMVQQRKTCATAVCMLERIKTVEFLWVVFHQIGLALRSDLGEADTGEITDRHTGCDNASPKINPIWQVPPRKFGRRQQAGIGFIPCLHMEGRKCWNIGTGCKAR